MFVLRIRHEKGTTRLTLAEGGQISVQVLADRIAKELNMQFSTLQLSLDFQGTTKISSESSASLLSIGIEHGSIIYVSVAEPEVLAVPTAGTE